MKPADRIPRTRDELEEALRTHVYFLRRSAALFDAGEHLEAKSLAGTMRTLLLDRGRSKSLLGQLGYLGIPFFDAYAGNASRPGDVVHFMDGLPPPQPWNDSKYQPDLSPRTKTSTFDAWWAATAMVRDCVPYSRESIVLAVAETDGGVHEDEGHSAEYVRLAKIASWTMVDDNGTRTVLDTSPVPSLIRQFAFELDQSLVAAGLAGA